ncbi:hypothetical protein AB0J47_39890 [Nocardia sp. NPDC049737]|uniref:hypothetical protein n=1 Tax=Nocardia sp. NPDC049737 TaxID=3154358 RepID=UPI00342997C6
MSANEVAVILYGPPAAGKDTITAALTELDPRFRLYRRLKVGPGRTTGYRIGSPGDLAELASSGAVIYSNRRYDSTYVIDRPELAKMLGAGDIPVLHVGQPEAVDALLSVEPAIRWAVIELWCPRDVAAARIEARATGDTADRLTAWDATPHLTATDLRIDTSTVAAGGAAQRIVNAVQPPTCTVVVPALHLVHEDGSLDLAATRRHAEAAGSGWIDFFLLNGSTTSGRELSDDDRAAVLDAWLSTVEPNRLLACSWSPGDLRAAADRHVTPMAVMEASDRAAAERFLRELPAESTIYSHPALFGGQTFTPELAMWAQAAGLLPLGGKLAKISLEEISEIHRVATEFAVWDGSSRHIQESLAAGAAGVVATPVAALLHDLPSRSIVAFQSAVDAVQLELDRLPDRPAKRAWLLERIRKALV